MQQRGLEAEWKVLQQQVESYERFALAIKLVAIVTAVFAYCLGQMDGFLVVIFLVFWLQDAIWKTFQSRLEERLLQVESALAQQPSEGDDNLPKPYTLHTLFGQKNRGLTAMLKEYLCQAKRPTVAFPHIVLVVLCLIA